MAFSLPVWAIATMVVVAVLLAVVLVYVLYRGCSGRSLSESGRSDLLIEGWRDVPAKNEDDDMAWFNYSRKMKTLIADYKRTGKTWPKDQQQAFWFLLDQGKSRVWFFGDENRGDYDDSDRPGWYDSKAAKKSLVKGSIKRAPPTE